MILSVGKHRRECPPGYQPQPPRRMVHQESRGAWWRKIKQTVRSAVQGCYRTLCEWFNNDPRQAAVMDTVLPPEDPPSTASAATLHDPDTRQEAWQQVVKPASETLPKYLELTNWRAPHAIPATQYVEVEVEPGAVVIVSPNRPETPVPLDWQKIDDPLAISQPIRW